MTLIAQVNDHGREQLHVQKIRGMDDLYSLALGAFLNRGHVLLEGPPGTGKTRLAKHLAQSLAAQFSRVQFTSDLLPADILGSSIYNQGTKSFEFIKGPIFTEILLADEVNRAPPRTQSALLEAMEERQVSFDNQRYQLPANFFVIATQNPLDFEGTFPLPEAQIDRFLLKLKLEHYPKDIEVDILKNHLTGSESVPFSSLDLPPQTDLFAELQGVSCDESLVHYVVDILQATRKHPHISNGASLRGGMAILAMARFQALRDRRDYIVPDDIKVMVPHCLIHRLQLSIDAEVNGEQIHQVCQQIVEQVGQPS